MPSPSPLLRYLGAGGHAEELDWSTLQPEQWAELVEQVVWHGVAPFLYSRLKNTGVLAELPWDTEQLRDVYIHCLLANRGLLEELGEVLDWLEAAGMPVLVLKGAHLASCVYADPAVRPMSDIDILARGSDVERVAEVLYSQGYRPTVRSEHFDYGKIHHLPPLSKSGSMSIELHHHLVRSDAHFDIDVEGLWRRATSASWGDRAVGHLSWDDTLLHLTTHAIHSDQLRGGVLASLDIDAVIHHAGDSLDWSRLAATAHADGRSRLVHLGLKLAQVLVGTRVPDSVFADLGEKGVTSEVLEGALALTLDTNEDLPVTVKAMSASRGPLGPFRALLEGIAPPPDKLRRIYEMDPQAPLLKTYVLDRPLDLLRRRTRSLGRLIWSSPSKKGQLHKERLRRGLEDWLDSESS